MDTHQTAPTVTTTDAALAAHFAFRGWARVELMGRRVRYGFVETRLWGTTGVLTVTEPREAGDHVETYGAAAVFCLVPIDEDAARRYHRTFGDTGTTVGDALATAVRRSGADLTGPVAR